MDERSYNRYAGFVNSLSALSQIRTRDLSDEFVQSGAGAKFNITFDLAWKVMKDIIIQEFAIVDFPTGSPREVLRKAFACGLISDDAWMQMLRDRNELTHDYDGSAVREVCGRILKQYLDLLEEFRATARTYYVQTEASPEKKQADRPMA